MLLKTRLNDENERRESILNAQLKWDTRLAGDCMSLYDLLGEVEQIGSTSASGITSKVCVSDSCSGNQYIAMKTLPDISPSGSERELQMNLLTTAFVQKGICPNFPIMFEAIRCRSCPAVIKSRIQELNAAGRESICSSCSTVFMELATGDLASLESTLTADMWKSIMFQVGAALQTLHAHGISHFDVSRGNILLQKTPVQSSDKAEHWVYTIGNTKMYVPNMSWTVWLADFGNARGHLFERFARAKPEYLLQDIDLYLRLPEDVQNSPPPPPPRKLEPLFWSYVMPAYRPNEDDDTLFMRALGDISVSTLQEAFDVPGEGSAPVRRMREVITHIEANPEKIRPFFEFLSPLVPDRVLVPLKDIPTLTPHATSAPPDPESIRTMKRQFSDAFDNIFDTKSQKPVNMQGVLLNLFEEYKKAPKNSKILDRFTIPSNVPNLPNLCQLRQERVLTAAI